MLCGHRGRPCFFAFLPFRVDQKKNFSPHQRGVVSFGFERLFSSFGTRSAIASAAGHLPADEEYRSPSLRVLGDSVANLSFG